MAGKKTLFVIVCLFVVSWMTSAVFGFLFIIDRGRNIALNNSVNVLQKNIKLLSEQAKEKKETKVIEDNSQQKLIQYFEWQFVLKEQVEQVNSRFLAQIDKIKGLKKNKELLNLLYYNLGLSFTLAVDFNSAIKAFEQAVNYNPKDAESYYNLGLLYSTYNQDNRKAVQYYNKYLEISPLGVYSQEVKTRINNFKNRNNNKDKL